MHIGINGHLLSLDATYRATGVSNYILHLLHGLSAIDSQNRYTVFTGRWARSRERQQGLALGPNFRLRPTLIPESPPPYRLLWEQTAQPLRSLSLDVLHNPVNVVPLVARAKRVVTIHDLAFLRFQDKHAASKRNYLRVMTRLSARRADVIIAVSECTRQDVITLLDASPEKVVTIPEAADDTYRPLGLTPKGNAEIAAFKQQRGLPDRYFLTIGTLEPRKNIPLLLDAYAQLVAEQRSNGDVPHLIIAGPKGWMFDSIFAKVKERGLESRVHFPGFVPRDEVVWWVNGAVASVYLSAFEGFGLPPLEAMSCGVPVLVNDASSLPEVVGDAGLRVKAEDTPAVTAALHSLATDADLRADLSQRSLERAAQFSWQRTAQATLAVYERALRS